uniref:Uncharacterized protein n=1 Tax=Oryza brachyantha TaxID=4533 RepID=J3M795_ORYBR
MKATGATTNAEQQSPQITPNLAPELPAEQPDAPSQATPATPAPKTPHARRSSTHRGRRAGRTSPHLHTQKQENTTSQSGGHEARQRHQG